MPKRGCNIALLQPTSPFLLAEHIKWAVNALLADGKAGSAQTVVPCPHNHHALNQRVIEDGTVNFRYSEERAQLSDRSQHPSASRRIEMYQIGG